MAWRVTLYSDFSVITGHNLWSIHSLKIPKALKTHLTAKPGPSRKHLTIKPNLAQCEAIILRPPECFSICLAAEILKYLITNYCPRPCWGCHAYVTVYASTLLHFKNCWVFWILTPRVLIQDNEPVLTFVYSFLPTGKEKEINAFILGLEKQWDLRQMFKNGDAIASRLEGMVVRLARTNTYQVNGSFWAHDTDMMN